MRLKLLLAGSLCLVSTLGHTQEIEIEGLTRNGELTIGNYAPFAYDCTIEWAPSVLGPWSSDWSSLESVGVAPGTVAVLDVPMLYRVVAQRSPYVTAYAHYPISADVGSSDVSGKGHHAAVIGASFLADRGDNDNEAFYFDGEPESYMAVPGTALNGPAEYTFVGWIYVKEMNRHNNFFWMGYQYPDYPTHKIGVVDDGVLRVDSANEGWTNVETPSQAVPANEWVFVAVRLENGTDQTGDLTVIINEARYVFKLPRANQPIATQTFLGRTLKGSLDDILIFHRALMDEEIEEWRTKTP